jgi:hypothetical protein
MNRLVSGNQAYVKYGNSIVIWVLLLFCACTKPAPDVPVIVTPPPTTSPPSGVITTFTMADSLVAYNKGTLAKWLVEGTNNQTVVTFNGVKVPTYGSWDTGPLKKTTVFTLAINNGVKSSVTVQVSDSISAYLWNDGKRLKIIQSEAYVKDTAQNGTGMKWVDTAIAPQVADQRISFGFNGSSYISQATPSMYVAPGNTGKYIVNATQTGFIWRNIEYTIVSLDDKKLVVTYSETQPDSSILLKRDTYLFE